MTIYQIIRPHNIVFVTIMRNKIDNTYSFINLTKEHICSCKFKTKQDAINDLNEYIKLGKIIDYKEIKEFTYADS